VARVRRAVMAAGAIGVAGCGLLNRKPQDTPAQIAARAAQDARIGREVEARLAAEPSIGAGRVRVAVDRGEVGLFGSVAGLGALRCAERNAELVHGVRLIIDQLVLDPGPRDVRCLAPRAAPTTSGSR
jgi:osmotically-inducible protein OsmY